MGRCAILPGAIIISIMMNGFLLLAYLDFSLCEVFNSKGD